MSMNHGQALAPRVTVADLRLMSTQDPRAMKRVELREWAITLSDVLPQIVAALDNIAVASRQVPPV